MAYKVVVQTMDFATARYVYIVSRTGRVWITHKKNKV
jgi:hypothetical protein